MVHRTLLEDEPGAGPGGKGSKAKAKGKVGEKGDTKGREGDDSGDEEEEGASYFDSYAHIDIHETMLKDKVRTEAYRDFIYLNKHLFAGKTVLDVGCGTGILSMFCARAGAARVYAVDNSDIVDKAREIVKLNGLQDVVTVLRGKIESTPLPTPVDIIVSEWMGYCLLFEAMLDSVLVAREAHLRKGGILAPGGCEMHAALWSDPEWIDEHVGYFGDVYGFAMEPLKEEFYKEGQVEVLAKDSIVSDLVLLKTWDIAACTVPSLDFTSTVTLQVTRRDVSKIYGIAVSFDVTFSGPSPDDHNVRMTTSPLSTPTHWKQGLLLLREPIVLDKDGPSEVTVQLSVCKGVENKRELEISAQVSVPRKSAVVQKWFVR
ncbi:S-adenosyl-L-methionine-dependent methyltransferase [Gonapodya prolifera JEL478]|uniref:type I protein arginine methyltransferase n=1 Tax=Gonapodya prolifera (strain JEL478) TaxID=1344416 RepID=A0A139AWV9_GONPJ|nr:S-adenosyl-L-methionine-dependent methyltransferase [Gonapodya prolifera JEL478]|eukprot:KXS21232.1 S-adenosyl-L-methionine-dependent methyltransferase [Gonapodya prolifera JEL478]